MEVKEWLDKLADSVIARDKISYFCEGIELIADGGCIQLYCGIVDLAEKAGVELREESRESKTYPVCLYFMHKGIKFMQLCTKGEPEYVRAAGK